MKIRYLLIGILILEVASSLAKMNERNLILRGDMEEIVEGSSPATPLGWRAIGVLDFESDVADFQSGTRSVKVRTPVEPATLASEWIQVAPNTEYEVGASVLARGDNQMHRPFVGLRLIGNRQTKYPAEDSGYLITWESNEKDLGFVSKTARFVTSSETSRVMVYLTTRARPEGIVNIDDVILREVTASE